MKFTLLTLGSKSYDRADKPNLGFNWPSSFRWQYPSCWCHDTKEKVKNMKRSRKYEKDKHSFTVQASHKNLFQVAQEQQLSFVVKEQVKNVNVYLTKVSSRLRKLLAADKILCQLPGDETRSGKEIKKLYGRLGEMSVRAKE